MRQVLLLILLCLVTRFAFAETANPVTTKFDSNGQPQGQISVTQDGQSNFQTFGGWGNDSTGNPGYMVLKGCDALNRCYPYYFWVASDGNLYQASYNSVSAFASFPSGNWNRTNMAVGSKVGSQ